MTELKIITMRKSWGNNLYNPPTEQNGSCNFVQDDYDGTKTLVMPLKNGTQKDVGLGPDFRRDDGKGKVRDYGTKNNNNEKELG